MGLLLHNFVLCLFVKVFYLKYGVFTRVYRYKGEKKARAATEGLIKWSVAMSDYSYLAFHFSVEASRLYCV